MDKGKFEKLNAYHVVFLVQNVIAGEAILTLPHRLSAVGYNQWWAPVVMGILAQLTLFPMVWLCRLYPNQNLFAINEILLGRILGRTVNLFYIAYGIISVSSVCHSYIRLVHTVVLPDIPIIFPTLCLFAVTVYVVNGGIKSIARFCILSFFFTIWMTYYLRWGFAKGDILHIFPLFHTTWKDLWAAMRESAPAMLGYELLMIYFPYIIHKQKALKHASIALWIVVVIYTLITFTSVLYFSEWQLENLLYPVLNLFKAVELSFIERIETLGITLWVFLILTTISAYIWVVKKGIDSLASKNRISHLYTGVLIALAIVLIPVPAAWKEIMFKTWGGYLAFLIVCSPAFLLLLHRIRRKGVP